MTAMRLRASRAGREAAEGGLAHLSDVQQGFQSYRCFSVCTTEVLENKNVCPSVIQPNPALRRGPCSIDDMERIEEYSYM